jgi:single-strand DNA-binding protein
MSVNKVILVGNCGDAPVLAVMPSLETVANFSVATTDRWTDKGTGEKKEATEWHRIVAYGNLAENIGKYLTKGRQVYIEGKLRTRKFTDKDGVDRYTTEVVAREVQFLGSRSTEDTSGE